MNDVPAQKASYLITFRDREGTRLPLLRAVISRLSSMQLEIIIVEQDDAPHLDSEPLPPNARVLFVYNDGPFNKSWGLNVAARRASHDVLVTADADMFMPGDVLARAVAVCGRHYDAVNPYSSLVDLTEGETRAFLAGDLDPEAVQRKRLEDRRPQGEHICFCGGICVFRREAYFALGGMDERFLGWGGEDDAMSLNLQRYTDRLAVQRDSVAWHLWHPRAPDRYRHAHYRTNLALAQAYRACDQAALVALRTDARSTMGDPDRYAGGR